MQNQHLSFEEFKALFQDSFESQEELLREYNSFLLIFEQLDQTSVPDLSPREKAEIFKRSWQRQPREFSWVSAWLDFFKQPAVTFALGIVIGCIVTLVVTNEHLAPRQTVSTEQLLTVEKTEYTQTYQGKVIKELYPQFENPKIVVERAEESSVPHRVLHGTLDDGEIYVVWNL